MTTVLVKVAKRDCRQPHSNRAAAEASLRISNAMPAAPAGNIEKSLCTVWRLTVFQLGRNAKGGIPGQFFRRSRIFGVRSILKLRSSTQADIMALALRQKTPTAAII